MMPFGNISRWDESNPVRRDFAVSDVAYARQSVVEHSRHTTFWRTQLHPESLRCVWGVNRVPLLACPAVAPVLSHADELPSILRLLWVAVKRRQYPPSNETRYLAVASMPAASASFGALSVFSQLKSESLRPKWPPAAVLQ